MFKRKKIVDNLPEYKQPVIKIPILTTLIRLIYWKIKDVKANKNKEKKLHLYGIEGYFGLPGFGKTMAMSKRLLDYRKKYGDDVIIMTNYGFSYEDKPFTHWKQLLEEYPKTVIFAWDEVQNQFNSRDYKNFPTDLLTLLTQNRKGNGKMILYTAQRWHRVDKVFRELTTLCHQCKTRMGRLTGVKSFLWEDYEQLITTTNVKSKMKIHPRKRDVFIQTDFIRNCYDSYQMLESAKSKEYMSRTEIEQTLK